MRFSMRALALTLAATSALALATAAASANRLSTSTKNIRATWSEMTFRSAGQSMTCPVTLEGSFHSATMAKVSGALIGHISRATVAGASCRGGERGAEIDQASLPWHVRYNAFTGTLPNITTARTAIVGARIWSWFIIIWTHIETTATEPLYVALNREAGGVITGARADEASGITSREGESSTTFIGGTGTYKVLGTTTNVTRRLI